MKRLCCLFAAAVIAGCLCPRAQAAQTASSRETQPSEPERYVFTFAGDCTFGGTPNMLYADVGFVKTVGDDFAYPFRNVSQFFREDDFTLVNLEGPLTENGGLVSKKFNFKGPVKYTAILTENSVEAVTVANNHTHDYGQTGYQSTLDALDAAGISYAQSDSGRVVTLPSGITLGLYGMIYYRYPTAGELQAAFDQLRQQGAELIIFLPHWGIEKTYIPTAQQVETAHAAIDAGADIVCGSHPHVLQSVERYGSGVIYYSLGNFSFGGNTDPEDYDTVVMQQEILRNPDGKLVLGETLPIPACISSIPNRNNFQPTPYAQSSADWLRVMGTLNLLPGENPAGN